MSELPDMTVMARIAKWWTEEAPLTKGDIILICAAFWVAGLLLAVLS